ncbi:LysE family translocator [Pelagicoccus mobilis]|uniref:LysE family translocator n=1 Tax=Pelagicoccus mobilis TaxID=415221 RepID=A0A934S0L8_9BACT|nr:LysE family translocator [Pelagicoccus mobilis]MBK1876918.1 LysE family translocator [Pelagicoccus mobilis]
MFELSQWLVFIGACLALVAVPGPAVIFIVARSVSDGLRVGLVTAAGIGLGNLTHAIAAAFGVSAVVASIPWAMDAVRYLGAAYLIYLGLRGLLARSKGNEGATKEESSLKSKRRSDFAKGYFVALLNPKVILFLLAFLPQFVSQADGEFWLQLLVLGCSFVFIGWIGDSTWALLAGSVSARLRKGAGERAWVKVVPAVVFIGLGIMTAFAELG